MEDEEVEFDQAAQLSTLQQVGLVGMSVISIAAVVLALLSQIF